MKELNGLPRRNYLAGPTPLEKLDRLTAHLGGPQIYMKRDDLASGLAGGGNKARKLEFIVADALSAGADTLITCGAIQSNHCRLTLAAAAREGLQCRLVLQERVRGSYSPRATGNNLLFHLMAVEKIRVVPNDADMPAEMAKELADLQRNGRRGYIIPLGGSNELGSLGYFCCAREILEQTAAADIDFDFLVCPTGSGGTYSGLLTGLLAGGADMRVLGISVSGDRETMEQMNYDLSARVLRFMDYQWELDRKLICCFDEYVGPGYSIPSEGMKEAVRLLGRLEGILLDPTYSGKAMAGLIDLARKGFFKAEHKVLFVHTGGVPALYAYAADFLS